jgi:hypothetical protein
VRLGLGNSSRVGPALVGQHEDGLRLLFNNETLGIGIDILQIEIHNKMMREQDLPELNDLSPVETPLQLRDPSGCYPRPGSPRCVTDLEQCHTEVGDVHSKFLVPHCFTHFLQGIPELQAWSRLRGATSNVYWTNRLFCVAS